MMTTHFKTARLHVQAQIDAGRKKLWELNAPEALRKG